MSFIEIRRRLKRFDILDYAMIKAACIIVGIIIATYFSALRGFVEQNIAAVVFIMAAIAIRPLIRYLK